MSTTTRTRALAVALGGMMLVAGACGGDDDDDAAAPGGEGATRTSRAAVSVISSFYPIHEIVSRVGGDRVDASNLTPAGVEPHDLDLTSDDIEEINSADAVFYLGQGFMPALERALERAEGEPLDLLEGLPLVEGGGDDGGEAGAGEEEHADEEGEEHADEEAALDPHVWLDPKLMIRIARQVEETLSVLDPEGEEAFARNRADYQDDLEALDADFEATLLDCQRNVFVTSHSAFGYLARRYGLEEQGVSGLSPETEPDPNRIAELADLVERLGVPVVFAETLLPKKLADTLAREAGVKTDVLNPLEGLTEDEQAAGSDYFSVMRDNLAALDRALECEGEEEPGPEAEGSGSEGQDETGGS